ncbi:hypothetical protein HDU76_001055 [Blyttiomyces sp. JEL0837]|nr:hypothetical protein HDU76_001055 [Blyttiomyces sp. JEL0837]
MTSAARPTWLPAQGGGSLRDTGKAPLHQTSSKDLAAHTKLKVRQSGQNAPDEIDDRDHLKAKLLQAEREHKEKEFSKRQLDFGDEEVAKKRKLLEEARLDADSDDGNEEEDDDEDEDDDDDDDDEDDTAELLRELERIKEERANEKERLEREKREEEEKAREQAMLTGNPLLDLPAESSSNSVAVRDFSVKRRWDDDVVFKNQAKGVDDNPKKRFINDLLRSDFHRKFMGKCKHKLSNFHPDSTMVTTSEEKELYGGAIVAKLPRSFVDASQLREIPDNQEVFVDVTTDQSVIIELVQLVPEATNPAVYHFWELADDNGARQHSRILSVEEISPGTEAPQLPPEAHISVVIGQQQIAKFKESDPNARNLVNIYVAVVRLPQVGTDMIISYNHPVALGDTSSSRAELEKAGMIPEAAAVGGLPVTMTQSSQAVGMGEMMMAGGEFAIANFKNIVKSLWIKDWNLFVPE